MRIKGKCVLYKGFINRYGYGMAPGGKTSAHRAAWIKKNGEIKDKKLVLDHICRNPPCINTDHLRLVTQRENIISSKFTVPSKLLKRTKCNYGHPFSGSNLFYKVDGYRSCRKCSRKRQRKYYEKNHG